MKTSCSRQAGWCFTQLPALLSNVRSETFSREHLWLNKSVMYVYAVIVEEQYTFSIMYIMYVSAT